MSAIYLAMCLMFIPTQHEKDVLEMSQVRGWQPCPGDYAVCEKWGIPYKQKEYTNKNVYIESVSTVASK